MRNLRLLLAYDGTDFHGWQKQPGQRTVQGVIEQAVRRVAQHQVVIIGAGRTDAGVHARGQVANFYTTTEIPAANFHRAIGARIPKDITVEHVREVPMDFHSGKSSLSKLYRYRVFASDRRPVGQHLQRYTYHFWYPLDMELMRAAARAFIGEHDFSAMATRGSPRLNNVRRVLRCDIFRHHDEIRFDVEGVGFLYNMVRNMVGTLIEVGRGHWPVQRVAEVLASLDRKLAGPTAPARGLSMQWVRYDLPAVQARQRERWPGGHPLDGATPRERLSGDAPVMPGDVSLEEEDSA